MPAFDKAFAAAKEDFVEYKGKRLFQFDRFPLSGVPKFCMHFESASAAWRQGVRLKCDGTFHVNGQNIPGKGGFVLWQDTAPPTVEIEAVGNVTEVLLYNVWDMGDGTIHSWHNGAAMVVEELPNGRRYRCNDGEPDDDFDDLIFRIERLLPAQK
jgi:hypothetical protein